MQSEAERIAEVITAQEIDPLLAEITRLQEQLEAVTRERDELRSTYDARIQDMSERFRAVNVAKALKQFGPDRLAQIGRVEAAEARAARLEAALRRISDMCPATQEMTVAHMMADEAEAALDVKEAG